MTKDVPRGAVVSVRLSEDEQLRLRQIASEQGGSVSDVIRGFVSSAVGPELPRGSTTSGDATQSSHLNESLFWNVPDGAVANGATMTVVVMEEPFIA